MKATQIRMEIPVQSITSQKFRALAAKWLDGKVSPRFFHRDQAGHPVIDDYPNVIFEGGFANEHRKHSIVRITAFGACERELIESMPDLVLGSNEHFQVPCPIAMQTVYPSIRTLDESMEKYRIIRPVIYRQRIKDRDGLSADKIVELLEQTIRRNIDRFARASNTPVNNFEMFCKVEDTHLIPVVTRSGEHRYSYLCLKNAEFVANLDISGPMFLSGLATHGHGRVVPC